jgi:hypothetical protein
MADINVQKEITNIVSKWYQSQNTITVMYIHNKTFNKDLHIPALKKKLITIFMKEFLHQYIKGWLI